MSRVAERFCKVLGQGLEKTVLMICAGFGKSPHGLTSEARNGERFCSTVVPVPVRIVKGGMTGLF